jgi:hypothetical protein
VDRDTEIQLAEIQLVEIDAAGAASFLRMVAGDLEWFAYLRPTLALALAQ